MYTQTEISEQTGFDGGDRFTSEAEVREYFQLPVLRGMFAGWTIGEERDEYGNRLCLDDAADQDALDGMVAAVLEHKWHCAFGEIGPIEEVGPLPYQYGPVELYEDNAGGLHLRLGDFVLANVGTDGDDDALVDMRDLFESHQRGRGWAGITVYGVADFGLDHPETQRIATYTLASSLQVVGRPGNAGRRYLGAAASQAV